MRAAPWLSVERFRVDGPYGYPFGAFRVPHPPTNVTLGIIASSDLGWEHVSASLPNRTPNWREMEFVCRLFWGEDEAVMQLHPPRSEWVSIHPHCLHLWKPTEAVIPLPPQWMVGSPHLNGGDPNDPAFHAACEAHRVALAKELGL